MLLLHSWFNTNKLVLNINKTVSILFGKASQENHERSITINQNSLKITDSAKFLGVTIDSKLNWTSHVDTIKAKINRSLFILSRIRYQVNRKSLLTLYYSLIHPHLTYCIENWGLCAKKELAKLFKLQKRAVRIIMGAKNRQHTNALFKTLNILKLEDIIKHKLGIFMHSIYHKRTPDVITKIFPRATEIQTRQLRYTDQKFYEIPYRTNVLGNSVFVKGPKTWNGLPPQQKEIESIAKLKKTQKSILISYY
jgi:hypothetical protein